jgi:hypothetical protein
MQPTISALVSFRYPSHGAYLFSDKENNGHPEDGKLYWENQ